MLVSTINSSVISNHCRIVCIKRDQRNQEFFALCLGKLFFLVLATMMASHEPELDAAAFPNKNFEGLVHWTGKVELQHS